MPSGNAGGSFPTPIYDNYWKCHCPRRHRYMTTLLLYDAVNSNFGRPLQNGRFGESQVWKIDRFRRRIVRCLSRLSVLYRILCILEKSDKYKRREIYTALHATLYCFMHLAYSFRLSLIWLVRQSFLGNHCVLRRVGLRILSLKTR